MNNVEVIPVFQGHKIDMGNDENAFLFYLQNKEFWQTKKMYASW